MYQNFFGFKERPFKLVPDPDYLFMGKSHEEALAHLKYAVMSGEGFVELIGEVGTGKTLLCRVFLDNMAQEAETAYIFNPSMEAHELLERINIEFGIATHHSTTTARVDALNRFLIKQKAAGRKAILLIDEAQNLTRSALEQIRLLTNLETKKDKLLQIILVGQPELGEILDSYKLRQLTQRVTLSCWLRPFSFKETEAYIHHRLHVAACKPVQIFTRAAIKEIYRYTRGVPRLVNVSCDRALIAAYGEKTHRVTSAIVRTAISELSSRGERRSQGRTFPDRWAKALLSAGAALLFLFFGMAGYQFLHSGGAGEPGAARQTEGANAAGEPEKAAASQRRETPDAEKAAAGAENMRNSGESAVPARADLDLRDMLKLPNSASANRLEAAESVIAQWVARPRIATEYVAVEDDDIYFELASRMNGLDSYRVEDDLTLIHRLNLPAVLKMVLPTRQTPVYLVVCGIGKDSFEVTVGRDQPVITVSYRELDPYWSGTGYVLWKNFYHYRGTIPLDSAGDSVLTLKMHLKDIGFTDLQINSYYDEPTRKAVEKIQAGNDIPVDGYAGPLTQIILYNEKKDLQIPHLDPSLETGEAIEFESGPSRSGGAGNGEKTAESDA